MNFTSFVALKYLATSRENRFFSWISSLSVFGVMIGIAVMIVVLTVINSFESELRNRFVAANAHLLVYKYPAGLKNFELWEKDIGEQFSSIITGQSPFVQSDTMGRKEHLIHAILAKGIHPEKRKTVQALEHLINPKESVQLLQEEINQYAKDKTLPDLPGIIVGKGLLSVMQAKIGDTIELVSPQDNEQDPFSEMMHFQIIGVYDSGLQHYDNKLALLSLPAAQKLFHVDESVVTGIEIGLKQPNHSIEIAREMLTRYDVSVKEWQSYNQNIFEMMRTERTVITLIVALVAFVASFNILTTLFVSVTQRQREISILKALGATNRQIITIFIKQSTLMGFLGGVLGIILALVLSFILKEYPFIQLPDIYNLNTLPVMFDPKIYLVIFLTGVFLASLAGLYPAWSAARISPTDGLTARQGREQ